MDEELKWVSKEVSNKDESAEEVKSRNIFLKINQKQHISKPSFLSSSDEIDMDDVTHYTEEAQKIATKWNEKRRKKDS